MAKESKRDQQPKEDIKQPEEEARQPKEDIKQPEEEARQPEEDIKQPEGEARQPEEDIKQPEEIQSTSTATTTKPAKRFDFKPISRPLPDRAVSPVDKVEVKLAQQPPKPKKWDSNTNSPRGSPSQEVGGLFAFGLPPVISSKISKRKSSQISSGTMDEREVANLESDDADILPSSAKKRLDEISDKLQRVIQESTTRQATKNMVMDILKTNAKVQTELEQVNTKLTSFENLIGAINTRLESIEKKLFERPN